MTNLRLKALLKRARSGVAYWTELAVLDYTSALWSAMRRKGLSQIELANRIGKKPAFISRVLNGASNVTIKTMVEMALALDMRVQVALIEKEDTRTAYTSITANVVDAFGGEHLVLKATRTDLTSANEYFAVVDAAA